MGSIAENASQIDVCSMNASSNKDESVPTISISPLNWADAYRKYIRFWINLASTSGITRDDAKDIVHSVVSSAMMNATCSFQSLEHIRNYVAKGVINRSIQAKQRADRHSPITEAVELKFAILIDEISVDIHRQREVLKQAIRTLPQRDFEILKLRFYSGLTFGEISTLLHLPVSTLKSREEAALKKLRRLLWKMGVQSAQSE
jgi:RNA polymerase sigma factor (sigma-70 family)